MAKIAFLFPGQGSQYVGMGQDLYSKYNCVKKVFDEADEILNFELKKVIFEGPADKLKETQFTQPAVFVTSIGCLEVLKEKGINAEILAGHSLGEYTAFVAAGSLTFSYALKLVQKRAQFMQEVAQKRRGTMAAIIGLSIQEVNNICCEVSPQGVAEPVNFNTPGQIVIAGDIKACEEAVKLAKDRGAMRAITLEVSGAFHSSLMDEASQKLALELAKYDINQANIGVIANFSADEVKDPEQIKHVMIKQLNNPVRWEDSMAKIIGMGIDTFIEVGPSRVLSGLIKRIDKKYNMLNVEDEKSLDKTLNTIHAG